MTSRNTFDLPLQRTLALAGRPGFRRPPNGCRNSLRYTCVVVELCALLIVAIGIASGAAVAWVSFPALAFLVCRVIAVVIVIPPDKRDSSR